MRSLVSYVGVPSRDLDDVMQDAMVRLWERREQVRSARNPDRAFHRIFELRSVLVQRDLFEIPMKEIAETRAIPLSTAYKWRTRALHGARGALARRLAAE
ncbi:hypothetical protein WME75_08145 [Sorangium sp. So ce1014]|uniref:hypothetical protein n=1 Tax=Sorangium sp. So ce1014 TaxID=3133326 RepID=UPI003F62012F